MTTAYEAVLIELGIDRTDPRTETIASAIVHRASTGQLNVRALADFAIARLNSVAPDEAGKQHISTVAARRTFEWPPAT